MKEATGELNITVITVVAIAAIAAFFYAFIWPAIKANLNHQTLCASAFNCTGTGTSRTCYAYLDNTQTTQIQCTESAASAGSGK